MYRANDGSCKIEILDGYPGDVDNNASTKHDRAQQVVRIANAEMHRDKRVSFACFQLKDDQPLAKAYTHSNNLVIMNETAITDALAHIEAIEDAEEDRTEEIKCQLLELKMAVSQEKRKRAAALAALIVYYWEGAQQDLMSLLNEELSEDKKVVANHEKWLSIDSQLKKKTDQLKALETQLHAQLQLVNALPVSVTGAPKALKKLRDLSEKWTQEQAAKEVLESDRQELLMGFLRGDDMARKLVKKLLAETWHLRG